MARGRALELKRDGVSATKIAIALNTEGLRSPNGQSWTESNVRALLK
ncbi:recombinase family protein [Aliiruegeria haliotis]